MPVKVKICGLTNPSDAHLAIEAGADFVGFIHATRSVRCIHEDDLAWISEIKHPKAAVFAELESEPDPCFEIVQSETPIAHRIAWQVIRVRQDDTPLTVLNQIAVSSTLVLDTYHPTLAGGTGQTFDWELAAQVVEASPVPVVLAGGLNPENVAEAVQRVRPYAVDVSSGVEHAPGQKDPEKVRLFIERAKNA